MFLLFSSQKPVGTFKVTTASAPRVNNHLNNHILVEYLGRLTIN